MTADPHLPAPLPDSLGFSPSREIASWVGHLALATTWCVRHPMEPFAEHAKGSALEPVYYRAADGWEAPLWRLPPRPGASGEPIVLAHALGSSLRVMDWSPESSLVRRLHRSGFDVYLFEHRGDPSARPPVRPGPADLDAIIAEDIPAALERVRALSGYPRTLWLGHGFGGQLAYAYLSLGGSSDLAAAVTVGAPVRFERAASRARLAARALRLLPPGLRLPTRRLTQVCAPLYHEGLREHGLSKDTSGPRARGLMVQGVADLSTGLLRQAARWIESGTLCDREDQLDYVAALSGKRIPILGVAAHGDPLCRPWAAWPALDAMAPADVERLELDDTWGHLDPLVGERAELEVMPVLEDFLDRQRRRCRAPRGPAALLQR